MQYKVKNLSGNVLRFRMNEGIMPEDIYDMWQEFKKSEEYSVKTPGLLRDLSIDEKMQKWLKSNKLGNLYDVQAHTRQPEGAMESGVVFEKDETKILTERETNALRNMGLERKAIKQKLKLGESTLRYEYEGYLEIKENIPTPEKAASEGNTSDGMVTAAPTGVKCQFCDRELKNAQAVRMHIRQAHKDKI